VRAKALFSAVNGETDFGKLPQISNEQPDQNGVLQHLSNAIEIKIRLGYVQSVFI